MAVQSSAQVRGRGRPINSSIKPNPSTPRTNVTETGKRQTAIVTGGARGIGLGIARRLAADGRRVIIWDNAPGNFDRASAGFEPLILRSVDVTDAAAVAHAFAEAVKAAGSIEILVNNAGINGPVTPTWDYPLDAWQRVLDINLTGVFHGCRVAVPHMRERGYGRIVNVASIAGKEGVPGISAYSAAKAGVIALTKSLAKELAHDGVTANCIAPAMTETDLFREMTPEHIAAMKAKIPMGRFLQIPEIAAMVAWIASPECSFTTGFTFDLTGGRATY
jgi:2-dehydro-3-deoxy-L-rhamnonate dehydrogenase (NAD+)